MEHSPDGRLLEQFLDDGDQEAFGALVRRHGPYVLGVCRRVTAHAQDAEDVFQACFLELARKARSIVSRGSVAGWLQTVAVRLALKARARRTRCRQREEAATVTEAAVPPEDITWREVRQVLEEEIANLPEDLREPIVLCLFQEQTQEEAAQNLHINPRTLKDRLRRGRELLRGRLTRRGVTLGVLAALLAGGQTQAAVPAALQQATVQGAVAVANKAPLAGVVSPAVLALTTSPPLFAGWGLVAAVLLGLSLLGGAYVTWYPTPPEPPPAAVPPAPRPVQADFRGKQLDPELFELVGPRVEDYLRREDTGLRITLPAKDGPADPVGVKLRYPVRGDFELAASLEFLDVPRPAAGYGAGAGVYFYMDSPRRDGVLLAKLHDPLRGMQFLAVHRNKDEKARNIQRPDGNDRNTRRVEALPTNRDKGTARLRADRQGAVFRLWAAEGDEPFRLVDRLEVSDADLLIVRLAADPGWFAHTLVDVRLLDFSLTAEEIVGYDP